MHVFLQIALVAALTAFVVYSCDRKRSARVNINADIGETAGYSLHNGSRK